MLAISRNRRLSRGFPVSGLSVCCGQCLHHAILWIGMPADAATTSLGFTRARLHCRRHRIVVSVIF